MNKTVLECNGIAAGYVKGLNILQGVDLVINEKEIVSIIGPNGAGKSTLLKAIMGIINVSAGRFFINGVEKTDTPTHKIVEQGVAYVPQVENVFPSLTIEENIEIGSWTVNKNKKETISQTLEQFSLLKDRRKEKAGNLSGGQRQRISIARAILKNPEILILDEATSAVDNETEAAIQRSINTLKEGRTVIAIAHRLSTIRNAEIIYVLEEGKVVESGNHESLLEINGVYSKLWSVQTGEKIS